jgi:hypothetical protein
MAKFNKKDYEEELSQLKVNRWPAGWRAQAAAGARRPYTAYSAARFPISSLNPASATVALASSERAIEWYFQRYLKISGRRGIVVHRSWYNRGRREGMGFCTPEQMKLFRAAPCSRSSLSMTASAVQVLAVGRPGGTGKFCRACRRSAGR